ncbi:MAG: integrase family protein [Rickettsiales bacterium]|jgi:integrase|nr:integrase family protein [Rickettsiales bacterium]
MGKILTKTLIDRAPLPTSGQTFIWDSELKGFGLRLTPTRKTYIVQSRAGGRSVRKTIAQHGVFTPEQARKEAKAYLGQMSRDVDLNAEDKKGKKQRTTLQEASEVYFATRSLADSTLESYKAALDKTFNEIKDRKLVSINRDTIERIFKTASANSPANANRDFRFLRAVFNFAMEKYATGGEPLIPSNPCNRLTALKLWNRIERKTRYITEKQLPIFMAALQKQKNDTDYIKVVKSHLTFLIFTGCREQEAARLRWCDIDFANRTFTLERTKNHHRHTLPLGNWLTKYLREMSHGKKKTDFVFPANNRQGHIANHRKAVGEISIGAGVPFALHDLRRTFATIADLLGGESSGYTIKKLLNHSSSGDVTGGYIQHPIEKLRRPMQNIETFILEKARMKK